MTHFSGWSGGWHIQISHETEREQVGGDNRESRSEESTGAQTKGYQ